MAEALLQLDVGRHLVQGHVARPLDHHLHVSVPRPLGQLAKLDELGYLPGVGGIGQTPRPQGVTQRDGHVIAAQNLEQLVVALIEGVLVTGHLHPGKDQRPTPADDVHRAARLGKGGDRAAVDAGVDGHEIHTLTGMGLDDLQKVIGGDVLQILLQKSDGVIHGDGADHGPAALYQLLPELPCLAVVGEVHNGLHPKREGQLDLLHFQGVVEAVARDT